MNVNQQDLQKAVARGVLSHEQADCLWKLWQAERVDQPRFDLPNVAFYFGAMIVISAMGWFMNTAWQQLGGLGLFGFASMYAVCFTLAGHRLWQRPGLRIAGGLLVVMAVCMTPLAIYGMEKHFGIWPQSYPGGYRDFYHLIRGGWLWLELGLLSSSLLALAFYRFPFLTAPLSVSLYFLSMDLAPLLLEPGYLSREGRWISLFFGLFLIGVAMTVEYWQRRRAASADYSFWLYVFGASAFWGGLTLLDSNSEFSKFLYCLLNVGLLLFAVLVQRRIFSIFGALGVSGYIFYLAYRVFKDSLLFPIVLSGVGLAIIALGVYYSKYRQDIEQAIVSRLPKWLRRVFP